MTYQEWIDWYVVQFDNFDVSDLCQEATLEMVESFPELRRVRGEVHAWHRQHGYGTFRHWWCVDPETGEIIDPTRSQFDEPTCVYSPMVKW